MTEGFKLSKAEYIIQQLNVQTAKKICFILALSFILYHSFLHFKYGKYISVINKFKSTVACDYYYRK